MSRWKIPCRLIWWNIHRFLILVCWTCQLGLILNRSRFLVSLVSVYLISDVSYLGVLSRETSNVSFSVKFGLTSFLDRHIGNKFKFTPNIIIRRRYYYNLLANLTWVAISSLRFLYIIIINIFSQIIVLSLFTLFSAHRHNWHKIIRYHYYVVALRQCTSTSATKRPTPSSFCLAEAQALGRCLYSDARLSTV